MNENSKVSLFLSRLVFQKLLSLLFYLIGAGWLLSRRAAWYFGFYIVFSVISGFYLALRSSAMLAERNKTLTDSPLWDKILLGTFWLLNYFIVYLIAGIETAAEPALNAIFWLGLALGFISGLITIASMRANTFFESTARLQTDREQTVCQSGPYAVVRHPGYAAVLLNCLSLALVFQTNGVMICAGIIAAIIALRTQLEDRMLQSDLAGYRAYAEQVRFRLVPFIW